MDERPLTSKASILHEESFHEGFYELLLRSWWRRLWVVQEVTLAVDVTAHCGDLAVDFRQLLKKVVDVIFFLSDEVVIFTYVCTATHACSLDLNYRCHRPPR